MSAPTLSTASTIAKIAHPWGRSKDIAQLLDWIGDAQYVLLGSASYGTHEYHMWRSKISQELITKKDFSFVATEADWHDCYRLNRYVKQHPSIGEHARTVLGSFSKWPSWIWATDEIAQFADWLRGYNAQRSPEKRLGLYGLDTYQLWRATHAVPTFPLTTRVRRRTSAMVHRRIDTHNIRSRHMLQNLNNLRQCHGPESKVIVWAHNKYVGDARYTATQATGMVSLGQLARQLFGEEKVVLLGFGAYSGSMTTAPHWGASPQTVSLPPAADGSWESDLHSAFPGDKLILSEEVGNRGELWRLKGHRSIGALYNPASDTATYISTLLPSSYDAFIYLDHTTALQPLRTTQQAIV